MQNEKAYWNQLLTKRGRDLASYYQPAFRSAKERKADESVVFKPDVADRQVPGGSTYNWLANRRQQELLALESPLERQRRGAPSVALQDMYRMADTAAVDAFLSDMLEGGPDVAPFEFRQLFRPVGELPMPEEFDEKMEYSEDDPGDVYEDSSAEGHGDFMLLTSSEEGN